MRVTFEPLDRRQLPAVRALRPGARRTPRAHDTATAQRRRAARARTARVASALVAAPGLRAHVERLRRHQRRLDRPGVRQARSTSTTTRRRTATSLQTGEIALDAARTTFTLALGFGDSTAAADVAAAREPRPTGFAATCRRPTRTSWHGYLDGLAAPAGGTDRRAAHAVQRRADDGQGARGQDLPRRVHRLAHAAVGLCRQRRRGRRRLPLRVGARPLPAGVLAARRGRPRRRRPRRHVAVHPPAAGRRARSRRTRTSTARRTSATSSSTRPRSRSSSPGSSRAPTTRRGRGVRKAADALVARGPATPQERWEETGGYSPSTTCRR